MPYQPAWAYRPAKTQATMPQHVTNATVHFFPRVHVMTVAAVGCGWAGRICPRRGQNEGRPPPEVPLPAGLSRSPADRDSGLA